MTKDLPPTIETEVVSPLESSTSARKGIQYVAGGLRKLAEWRNYFSRRLESLELHHM